MPFDEGFDKPRAIREPADYVGQITDSVCDSLTKLGRVSDATDFENNFFQPIMELFKLGWTADCQWAAIQDPATLEAALRANPKSAALRPPGAKLDASRAWATLALLFCIQAAAAENAGDVTTAWTFAVDARFAADAVISQITDHEMVALHKRGMAKRGAAARLERSPQQVAKAEAKKLWKERHEGKHPKLRTNEQFATECMDRWPALKSAKVILGWCTKWGKEARQKSQHAG